MARSKRGVPRLTASRAKYLLGLGKTFAPLLAPVAVKAASAARDGYDRLRARRLGVPVDDLATFSGRGGALHARIAGIAGALAEIRVGTNAEASRFATEGESRLVELAAAVRAAEHMPTARRKAAHRAVAAELSRIEAGLLRHLGV